MKAKTFLFSIVGLFMPWIALADKPYDWQLGFQEAASPVMEELQKFHDILLIMVYGVSIFVVVLLIYVCLRFRESKNPTPSKTSHNTLLEVVWTAVPVLILVILAVPSLRTLYMAEEKVEADITLKVVGYKWNWEYIYPEEDISFISNIIKDEDLKEGDIRLLEVDERVVLPVDTNVRVQVTAADVIHSWAVPALGVKKDAIPGRLNETWLRINKPGVYYGQCSELCGEGHGFMPIAIEAVSKQEYAQWVESQK